MNRRWKRAFRATGRFCLTGLQILGSWEAGFLFTALPVYTATHNAKDRDQERPEPVQAPRLSGPPPGHPEKLVATEAQTPIEQSLRNLMDELDRP